jgi:hypothetical protein
MGGGPGHNWCVIKSAAGVNADISAAHLQAIISRLVGSA